MGNKKLKTSTFGKGHTEVGAHIFLVPGSKYTTEEVLSKSYNGKILRVETPNGVAIFDGKEQGIFTFHNGLTMPVFSTTEAAQMVCLENKAKVVEAREKRKSISIKDGAEDVKLAAAILNNDHSF